MSIYYTPIDPTEAARRDLVPAMPAALAAHVAGGGQIWTTDEMRAEFSVQGFMAPFVVVRRKDTGQTGTLEFTHAPRWYFDWKADA